MSNHDSNEVLSTEPNRRDDGGFVLIGVLIALVPVGIAVGTFMLTMQGKSSRLRTDLAQERALLVAESGIDDAIFRANQGLITHGGDYTRDLGGDQRLRVEPIHLQYDGVDNDGDGDIDLADPDEEVFQIVVTGTYGTTSRRIAAYLGPRPFLPTIDSAIAVQNPAATLDFSGLGYVTGEDTTAAGAPVAGTTTDVHGLSISPPGVVADLLAQISAGEVGQVLGVGATATDPSVTAGPAIDLVPIVDALRNSASIVVTSKTNSNDTFGTIASPAITFREGDVHMTGTTTGAGILVVTGDLRASGQFEFVGVVIVLGDINSGVGQATIRGAMVTSPATSDIDFSGQGSMSYSSEGIAIAQSLGGNFTSFNGWQELSN